MKTHLLSLIIFAAIVATTTHFALAASPPRLTDTTIKMMQCATFDQKAALQAKVNPAAAAKLYEQALQLYPADFEALIGLGDCKEAITGNPKEAIPYYRKALFDSTTGDFRKSTYFNDTTLLTSALLFQRAGEMPEALKLYNRAAKQMRYWPHKTTLQHPVPLPYLPSDAAPLELSALIQVGLGLDSEGHGLQTEQANFEAAVAIKDTPTTRFYLDKFKKEHPDLYKVDKAK